MNEIFERCNAIIIIIIFKSVSVDEKMQISWFSLQNVSKTPLKTKYMTGLCTVDVRKRG